LHILHPPYSIPRQEIESKFVQEGVTFDIIEDWYKWKHIVSSPPIDFEDEFNKDRIIPDPSPLTELYHSYGFNYTSFLDVGNAKNVWYSHTDLDIDIFKQVESVRKEKVFNIKTMKSMQDAYRDCKYRIYITETLRKEAERLAEENDEPLDFTPPDFGPSPTYMGFDGEEYSIEEEFENGCQNLQGICEMFANEINENELLECELIEQYLGPEWAGTDLNTYWWSGWLPDELLDQKDYVDIDTTQSGVTFSAIDLFVSDRYVRPPYEDILGAYQCKGHAEVNSSTGLVKSRSGFTSDVCGCIDPDEVSKTLPKYVKSCGFPNFGERYPEYLEYVASKDARFWNTPMATPLFRKAQEAALRAQEIEITVPGDFGLKVGMLIELSNVPAINTEGINESIGESSYSMLDGVWMIIGIKHSFEAGGIFKDKLTCVRDGVYQP
jgi:hypothetical protein